MTQPPQNPGSPFPPIQPVPGAPMSPAPGPDRKGLAIGSLVLGIVGLIAWLIPLLGFPVTVAGLVLGVLGQKSTKKALAIIGLVLSILGLVGTIINMALGAYLGATGQL